MWKTKEGQLKVAHLLQTEANIRVVVSENIGVHYVDGKYYAVYGDTGPSSTQNTSLIKDYGRGKVYAENTITLFKGTFEYSTGHVMKVNEGKITVIDPKTRSDISDKHIGKVKIEPSQNPDKIYPIETQFYNFTGTHETTHTESENIKLQRSGRDAETPAYQSEDRSRKQLNN